MWLRALYLICGLFNQKHSFLVANSHQFPNSMRKQSTFKIHTYSYSHKNKTYKNNDVHCDGLPTCPNQVW